MIDEQTEQKPQTQIFQQFLEAAGWEANEHNQGIEGYFANKPGGSRCLWSVRWSSGLSKHITEPGDMMPLDLMSVHQIAVELMDYKARGSDAAGRVLGDIDIENVNRFRVGAIGVITDERLHVPEFVFQEVKPRFLMWNTKRPGWEVRDG
jgi:hypothetical protein